MKLSAKNHGIAKMKTMINGLFCIFLLCISSAVFAASPNLTTIPSATHVIDSAGAIWTVNSSGTCYRNGAEAAGWCRGIKTLLWYHGYIYVQAENTKWHQWTGTSFVNVAADPRPTPSVNGAAVPPASQLVDSNYGVWTVDGKGICYLDGVQAGGCSNVKTLLWTKGQMYVYNTGGLWYHWKGTSWELLPLSSAPVFNPAVAGYSLKFNGTFGNAGDIDLANTGAPGFKWYPCRKSRGVTPPPRSDFNISPAGVLTIRAQPGDTTGSQLCSAAPTATAPYWTGNTFSGGWYVEYSIAFDNTTVDLPSGEAWPAIWALPVQTLVPYGDRHAPPAGYGWPGQPSGYTHSAENDLFEYDTGWPDGMNAPIHDWRGIYNTSCRPTPFCDLAPPFSQEAFHLPPIKWTTFNTFGQLWIPGTAGNNYQGSTTNYFNGIKMPGGSTWKTQGVGNPSMLTMTPDVATPGFDFSIMDQENFFLILGTGQTTPLQVQWVRVWQKP
jgi:hypothetical protein